MQPGGSLPAPGATPAAGGDSTATPGAAGPALADQSAIYSQRCLISLPTVFGIGGGCLLSKAEGRVILGGLLMVGGGIITAIGVILLASYGLEASGAGGAASKSAEAVGAAATLVGMPEVGVPVAAAGAAGSHHEKHRREKQATKHTQNRPDTSRVEA